MRALLKTKPASVAEMAAFDTLKAFIGLTLRFVAGSFASPTIGAGKRCIIIGKFDLGSGQFVPATVQHSALSTERAHDKYGKPYSAVFETARGPQPCYAVEAALARLSGDATDLYAKLVPDFTRTNILVELYEDADCTKPLTTRNAAWSLAGDGTIDFLNGASYVQWANATAEAIANKKLDKALAS